MLFFAAISKGWGDATPVRPETLLSRIVFETGRAAHTIRPFSKHFGWVKEERCRGALGGAGGKASFSGPAAGWNVSFF